MTIKQNKQEEMNGQIQCEDQTEQQRQRQEKILKVARQKGYVAFVFILHCCERNDSKT